MTTETQRLNLADQTIAYQQVVSPCEQRKKTGVMFLSGYGSDMFGTKACFFDAECRKAGFDFLRFDYRGHGLSSGTFTDLTIGDWAEDALAVLDRLTTGPQLLVGSSMGGWIALLLALKRPERVAGIVGLAAAPDFTEELVWKQLSEPQRKKMQDDGLIEEHGLPLTYKLIQEGRQHLLLDKALPLSMPVHLIQGQMDTEVPWNYPIRIAEALKTPHVRMTLVKDADHRLSRSEDLSLIWAVVEEKLKSFEN